MIENVDRMRLTKTLGNFNHLFYQQYFYVFRGLFNNALLPFINFYFYYISILTIYCCLKIIILTPFTDTKICIDFESVY